MLVLWIACAALGGFWLVEFAKAVIPWNMEPWSKQGLALVVVSALLWYGDVTNGSERWLAMAGACGASALIQRVHRWLGAAGDDAMASVMARGVRGRGR